MIHLAHKHDSQLLLCSMGCRCVELLSFVPKYHPIIPNILLLHFQPPRQPYIYFFVCSHTDSVLLILFSGFGTSLWAAFVVAVPSVWGSCHLVLFCKLSPQLASQHRISKVLDGLSSSWPVDISDRSYSPHSIPSATRKSCKISIISCMHG
ncbi:uncharacterized protein LY89DRAFT_150148 [Mollisia scopiformis]|uniref:Uncharacterized protein n=1 Tax=Mollisia scopiformis TaxID=149040 RepID=A0A194X1Q4_MOLSC|nr:uncharacterized protein LY89DRAFT_150148 [Mollisia scopiformis]KUJ13914.1 hypothetical protein LY89DRAFT_150148 [Mollisia scopiformis]